VAWADEKKNQKEEKVIGSDKKTGGEAPSDRPNMEKIRGGAEKLKERVEKEKKERSEKK